MAVPELFASPGGARVGAGGPAQRPSLLKTGLKAGPLLVGVFGPHYQISLGPQTDVFLQIWPETLKHEPFFSLHRFVALSETSILWRCGSCTMPGSLLTTVGPIIVTSHQPLATTPGSWRLQPLSKSPL